jgi:hypothetical protein
MVAAGEDVPGFMRAEDREKRQREGPSTGELIGMMPDPGQREEAGAGGERRIAVAKVEHEHGAGAESRHQRDSQQGNRDARLVQLRSRTHGGFARQGFAERTGHFNGGMTHAQRPADKDGRDRFSVPGMAVNSGDFIGCRADAALCLA